MKLTAPRQLHIGRWLGAYYVQMQYAASYVTPLNFVMLATTLWVTAREHIVSLLPWLTFPIVLAGVLILFLVILPVFDYVVMMRARMSYVNSQSWAHDNPGRTELACIKSELAEIKKILAEKGNKPQ